MGGQVLFLAFLQSNSCLVTWRRECTNIQRQMSLEEGGKWRETRVQVSRSDTSGSRWHLLLCAYWKHPEAGTAATSKLVSNWQERWASLQWCCHWLHGCSGLQLQDYCIATFPLSIPIFVQISFGDVLYTYPSTETKQNLAAAVIKAFSNLHLLGPLGYVRTVFPCFWTRF